jgi:hypothetical protein
VSGVAVHSYPKLSDGFLDAQLWVLGRVWCSQPSKAKRKIKTATPLML